MSILLILILYKDSQYSIAVLKADITLMLGSSETWPETRHGKDLRPLSGLPCFFGPSKFPDLSKKKIGVKILEISGVFPKSSFNKSWLEVSYFFGKKKPLNFSAPQLGQLR